MCTEISADAMQRDWVTPFNWAQLVVESGPQDGMEKPEVKGEVQLQHYQVLVRTVSQLPYFFQLGHKKYFVTQNLIHFGHTFNEQTEYKLVKDGRPHRWTTVYTGY